MGEGELVNLFYPFWTPRASYFYFYFYLMIKKDTSLALSQQWLWTFSLQYIFWSVATEHAFVSDPSWCRCTIRHSFSSHWAGAGVVIWLLGQGMWSSSHTPLPNSHCDQGSLPWVPWAHTQNMLGPCTPGHGEVLEHPRNQILPSPPHIQTMDLQLLNFPLSSDEKLAFLAFAFLAHP